MADAQSIVQRTVDELVESGADTGVQVAVYQDGELVVDAVAGEMDVEAHHPVTSDTLFFGVSAGKAVTSTLAHVLVEKGVLAYDTPIAEVWPEFAAHGKDKATLRHALIHGTGVPAVAGDITPETIGDWDKVVAGIADMEPWWEPGTKTGYHAVSYGFIVGEIIRRATGKSLAQALKDEVTGPLGVADDLMFGVPEDKLGRVASLVEVPPEEPPPAFEIPADHPMFRTAPACLQPSCELYNRRDFRTADIPSGGTMTAKALAKMYAALLGEVDGVRLVSPEHLAEINSVVTEDVDQVFLVPMPMKFGYAIRRFDPRPEHTEFGWSGTIGTHADADPTTGVTFAFLRNRYTAGDFNSAAKVWEAVAKATA
ncbi:beta-lactamase family protein [Saccharopolyspora indica]|uniref:serine hydrolase domain-containing protein n=1 Tax=Saccharopolyspora indica TaxID=1229659 RepID=UPI0022EAFDE4|nr:serine hydrolase domain-containing protein [Saccharopolyspora indica]MDA3647029.1 serine hydrolase [Saccharopolyspora indica]